MISKTILMSRRGIMTTTLGVTRVVRHTFISSRVPIICRRHDSLTSHRKEINLSNRRLCLGNCSFVSLHTALFGSYETNFPCHIKLPAVGFSSRSSVSDTFFCDINIMINRRHLILSSHRRLSTGSQSSSLTVQSPAQFSRCSNGVGSNSSGLSSHTFCAKPNTSSLATTTNQVNMQFLNPSYDTMFYRTSLRSFTSKTDQWSPPRKWKDYQKKRWSRTRLLVLSFIFALIPATAIAYPSRTSDDTGKRSDDSGILSSDNEATGTRRRTWLRFPRRRATSCDLSSSSCDESDESKCLQNRYQESLLNNVEVALIKLLPLKFISRVWGWINSLPLPPFLRVLILSWYCQTFNCNLSEAEIDDLSQYRCLGDFFKRSLKPGCRCVDPDAEVVSPSDGTVVHFGVVDEETVEQVKGVKYSLPAFLGPKSWPDVVVSSPDSSPSLTPSSSSSSLEDFASDDERSMRYHQRLVLDPSGKLEHSLYHCVIYLAPGDYHRFHSPTSWDIWYRRHFSGKLLSIRPSFMSWIEDLFTLNERVTYFGSWAYGFFSMTAVGATNVGSVRVYFDDQLKTNRFLSRHGSFKDKSLVENPVHRMKGDPFGEFNLGSTIVLIFEAPKGLTCSVNAGDKVKYGQKLFCYETKDTEQDSK